jgi:hypothetical protein
MSTPDLGALHALLPPIQTSPQGIKRYYEELAGYATHEGATSSAFQNLLAATCKKADWHLVPQLSTRIRGRQVRSDGILRDEFNLHHGYWEAKDSSDKIDVAYEGRWYKFFSSEGDGQTTRPTL